MKHTGVEALSEISWKIFILHFASRYLAKWFIPQCMNVSAYLYVRKYNWNEYDHFHVWSTHMWLELVTDIKFAAVAFAVAVYPATFPYSLKKETKNLRPVTVL